MSAFVNYRVNFLGGLSHGALRNNVDGNTASGNWGIQDVLAGLTWVQNNIGNFGGDPTKVTIQGESAGATTVMSLVTSPLAYPPNVPAALFRGAIAQSVWPMMDNGVAFSQNVRDVAGNAMAWAMQCTTSYASTSVTAEFSAIAACLRTDSVQMAEGVQGGFFPTSQGGYVTTTQWSAFETANGGAGVMTYINWQTYGYSPCVDGYVWTKAPKDHAIDGVGVAVHLMVGNNANEEALFAPSYVGLNTPSYVLNNGYFYALYGSQLSHQSTAIEWVNAGNAMPTDVLQNLPYYSTIVDPWQRQTNQLDDGYFSANIGIIFDTFSAQTGRAANSLFRYVYGEPNQANAAPFLGAPHTAELTYVWGVYAMGKSGIFDNLVQADTPKTVYTAEEIAMGSTIQKYWANFIHTGTPNVASMNAPTWSGITATEKHTMVFRSTVRYGAKLDPCVMFVSCLAEPTADFRRAAITLWTSSFASKPDMATCSGPVEIGFSRIAPFQFADMHCRVRRLLSATLGRRSVDGDWWRWSGDARDRRRRPCECQHAVWRHHRPAQPRRRREPLLRRPLRCDDGWREPLQAATDAGVVVDSAADHHPYGLCAVERLAGVVGLVRLCRLGGLPVPVDCHAQRGRAWSAPQPGRQYVPGAVLDLRRRICRGGSAVLPMEGRLLRGGLIQSWTPAALWQGAISPARKSTVALAGSAASTAWL